MSKTPMQLAFEYCDKTSISWFDRLFVSLKEIRIGAFKSGYQAAQQWISVKDRLPPPQTEVLWWNKTAHQAGVSSWEYMPHCNDTMIYWGDAGNVSIKNFTHWMPLPKPPEK
jgi:hypothetical protein